MLLACQGIIWVTNDAYRNPKASMATRMIRTVRSKRHFEGVNFITLNVDSPILSPSHISESILQLYRLSFWESRLRNLESNSEYTFRDGLLWINKLHIARDVNQFLDSKFSSNPNP